MGNETGSSASTGSRRRIQERFLQARFFLGAILFHVALFVLFATKVVIDAVQAREHTFQPSDTFVGGKPPPRAPDEPSLARVKPEKFPANPSTTGMRPGPRTEDMLKDVIRGAPAGPAVAALPGTGPMGTFDGKTLTERLPRLGDRTKAQWKALEEFRGHWFTKGTGYGPRAAEFTVHIGQPSQGGDALAFVRFGVDGKTIIGGSIPNLAEMLNRFSKGKIKARVQGEVLRLDSAAIYETRPPFIYLTGRSDFRLTEPEILNLRKYLLLGGCIWGDNALPGHRSRFDIAFRREMKRVIPDDDKPFETLPDDHPIYGNGGFRLASAPSGLNFSHQPIETIRLDGVEAILYTANGYGAMWQVTLDDSLREVDHAVMQRGEKEFWEYRNIFYRNLNEDSLLRSYRLGYNIVLHLLLRHEARLRTIPGA